MNFDRLDEILKAKHISRRALALEVGIKESTMSTAFMRRSGLSSDNVRIIAEYLDVSPYYLEGWTNDPNSTDQSGIIRDFGDLDTNEIERLDAYDEQAKHKRIIDTYDKLNTTGQHEAVKRVEELTEIPRYTTPEDE